MNPDLTSSTQNRNAWQSRWPRIAYGTLAAALLGSVLVAWRADPFLVHLLGYCALAFVVLPLGIVAVVIFVYALVTKRWLRPPLILLGAVAGLALIVVSVVSLNGFVQERAVEHAKAYAYRVAPLLDAYREAHGAFPQSLDELPSTPRVPRLLRGGGYHSNGKTYIFAFPAPGGLIDEWVYTSESRQWQLST